MQENSKIDFYQDELHAENKEDIRIGDFGYKYRILNGLMMPPYVTPERYQVARTMTLRENDVSYCAYPKSGSTWLSNIIYLILHNGEIPEGDTLRNCLHWMESSWPYPRSKTEVERLPSPRIFKSHMPYDMALAGGPSSNQAKYIYIARNPKDVCVSYFHFESDKAWSGHYNGSWEHWFNAFMEGHVQRGSWFDHVLSWWQMRNTENLLFLKYEDLKRDFENQLIKIATFLGYSISPGVVDSIIEKTGFEQMKSIKFSSHQEISDFEGFFRKGEIGSWKAQSRIKNTGLEFDFE